MNEVQLQAIREVWGTADPDEDVRGRAIRVEVVQPLLDEVERLRAGMCQNCRGWLLFE